MTFLSLRSKEVINIADGSRLGYVCDMEIDVECGRVCALILPAPTKLFSRARPREIRIPWSEIAKIGDDFILVCRREHPLPPPEK